MNIYKFQVKKIYLTGGKPFYDKSSEPHLSESLAMAIYLSDIKMPDSHVRDDIYIDSSAKTAEQNVKESNRPFFSEKNRLGKGSLP